jgi:hypothetical protein
MTEKSIPKSPDQGRRPKKVRFPLIVSKGLKVNVTNRQIYEHVEFP